MSDEVKLLPCEINAELLNRSATYRALLKRCAKHLEATDCGTGQLHWDIRQALLSSVTDEVGAAIEATRPPIGTDEVVERVATALVECGIYPGGRLVGFSRDAYLTWARAAIAAMKDAASD